jgi:hypothetical protein
VDPQAASSRSSRSFAACRATWPRLFWSPSAAMEMVETGEPGYRPEEEFRLTRLTCPECGGGFRLTCRKSATSAATSGIYLHHRPLAAAQADASEKTLWSAVAALEKQAALLHRLASRRNQGPLPDHDQTVNAQQRYAEEVARRAAALRTQVRAWSSEAT